MNDCIFCKIVRGEIPSQKIYEDDDIMAFKDIKALAPIHYLFIPKKHFATLNDIPKESLPVVTHIFEAIQKVAKTEGIAERGYRVFLNTNKEGGQMVYHVHWHLIGGRQFSAHPEHPEL